MAGLRESGNEPPGSLKASDNAGEMSPRSNTESYPAFAHIGLRENPEKTPTRLLRSNPLDCLFFGLHVGSIRGSLCIYYLWHPSSEYGHFSRLGCLIGAMVYDDDGPKLKSRRRRSCICISFPQWQLVGLKESLPSKETLREHSDSSFRGEGYIQCCVGVKLCDMYSNQELAEIHFMYGIADGNAALARRLYQERYPQRQCPDRKTFVRLHYRLCEYGKFNSPGLGRERPRSTTPEVHSIFHTRTDGNGDVHMSSDLDIVAVGTSPGTNDEPAQHCRPPYRT
ncbi:hypothetical protein ANN_20787 [Periplaneta americana]|uniref:DUF4817 domain-containing protein n=1 Tax=Periplaneta americana TaxID=6978 RepID=A0ABQ8SER2_PERAM|nr:hypothetical protein ANN_20787 [Periplaneta americana]